MNFPRRQNSGFISDINVAKPGLLCCMVSVEESLSLDRYNWMHSQSELSGLETLEPCSFRSPAENDFPKVAPRTANGHFGQNVSTLGAGSIPQLEVNVAIRLCSDIDNLPGDLIPLFLLRLLARRLVVQAGKWRPSIHIRRFYGLERRRPSRYRGPLAFRFLSIRHMIVLASAWRREINGGLVSCDCVRQKYRRQKCDQHTGSLHDAARLVTALADAKQKDASSRSHDAVIRVYDEAGNVIETHTYKGEFKKGKKFKNIVVYDKQ